MARWVGKYGRLGVGNWRGERFDGRLELHRKKRIAEAGLDGHVRFKKHPRACAWQSP